MKRPKIKIKNLQCSSTLDSFFLDDVLAEVKKRKKYMKLVKKSKKNGGF